MTSFSLAWPTAQEKTSLVELLEIVADLSVGSSSSQQQRVREIVARRHMTMRRLRWQRSQACLLSGDMPKTVEKTFSEETGGDANEWCEMGLWDEIGLWGEMPGLRGRPT